MRRVSTIENAILKVQEYDRMITQNVSKFQPNSSMTENEFCDLIGLVIPIRVTHRDYSTFNFIKLSAYTELNKLLARRGVCIKQKNYGEMYEILPKESTDSKVYHYREHAAHMLNASKVLQTGRKRYDSVWQRLSTSEIVKVAQYIRTTSYNY